MYLAMHQPLYGYLTVESDPVICPGCRRNDWQEFDINTCEPGQELICLGCSRKVWINWGLTQPDHFSNWLTSEKCPHLICQQRYTAMKREMGWDGQPAVSRDAAYIASLRRTSLESQAHIQKMKEDWDNRPLWRKSIWWIRMNLLGIKFYLRGWKTVPENED